MSSLFSLPFASTVSSLSPASHLVVTPGQPEQISINNVGVSDTPIFDDGFVFVYAIDGFFNLNFTLADADSANPNPRSDSQCLKLESSSRFGDAPRVLKSRGYSLFSSNRLITDSLPLFFVHQAFGSAQSDVENMDEMANGTVVSNNVSDFSLEITKDEVYRMMQVAGGSRDQAMIALPEIGDEEMEVTEDFPVEEDNNSMAMDNGEFRVARFINEEKTSVEEKRGENGDSK
ncbi:fasciclin-like arabinogalactan protein, partial [Striga asiatica]